MIRDHRVPYGIVDKLVTYVTIVCDSRISEPELNQLDKMFQQINRDLSFFGRVQWQLNIEVNREWSGL